MYKGKAIYNPQGKAGEYAKWACNFYVGCSNGCVYCYLRKGVLSKTMGGGVATLKKCFWDEEDAFIVFQNEVHRNFRALKQYGLFFSFTTDPMLNETFSLTFWAVRLCNEAGIPVTILTKTGRSVEFFWFLDLVETHHLDKSLIAYGTTLTGRDDLEPGAASNEDRVWALSKVKSLGFKTIVSVEPVVVFESSLEMIRQTVGVCDLWKIGLESGKRYSIPEMHNFVNQTNIVTGGIGKIYLKNSITNILKLDRFKFPENFVSRDFNLFEKGDI